MFGMNGWCKEPNNAGNGSDCPKNAQNSEDRTTGDLISREAAIDALSRCQTYLFDTRDTDRKISLEDAEYVIEKLPAAQPERNKGKWINEGVQCSIRCNNPLCNFHYIGYLGDYNFCPNCGADMRGEQNG